MQNLQSSARIHQNLFVKGYYYMFNKTALKLLALLPLLLLTNSAVAYVGPGAGISVLGSLLSILATIFVAIGAIIFWPLRKYMKRRKARLNSEASTNDNNT